MAYLSKINLDGTARDLKDAEAFSTRDSAETAIADTDTFPFYDNSASGKRKSTYSNLFSKLRTSLGSMTAAQLKAGSDTTIRGMRADYAREGIRKIIGEAVGNDTIETIGAVAQKSYAIGEYFYANDGYYYVATAEITANSTTLNTSSNCSKTSISGAIENLRDELLVRQLGFTDSDGSSTLTTNYGSVTGTWQIMFNVHRDARSRWPDANTICRSCMIKLQKVSSRPTVTLTNSNLANYGTFNGFMSCYRYGSSAPSAQYGCDYASYSHSAGSNKLTIGCVNWASTAPSNSYFLILK